MTVLSHLARVELVLPHGHFLCVPHTVLDAKKVKPIDSRSSDFCKNLTLASFRMCFQIHVFRTVINSHVFLKYSFKRFSFD